MFAREELAVWMQSSQRLEDFFQDTPANIEGNASLLFTQVVDDTSAHLLRRLSQPRLHPLP